MREHGDEGKKRVQELGQELIVNNVMSGEVKACLEEYLNKWNTLETQVRNPRDSVSQSADTRKTLMKYTCTFCKTGLKVEVT